MTSLFMASPPVGASCEVCKINFSFIRFWFVLTTSGFFYVFTHAEKKKTLYWTRNVNNLETLFNQTAIAVLVILPPDVDQNLLVDVTVTHLYFYFSNILKAELVIEDFNIVTLVLFLERRIETRHISVSRSWSAVLPVTDQDSTRQNQ